MSERHSLRSAVRVVVTAAWLVWATPIALASTTDGAAKAPSPTSSRGTASTASPRTQQESPASANHGVAKNSEPAVVPATSSTAYTDHASRTGTNLDAAPLTLAPEQTDSNAGPGLDSAAGAAQSLGTAPIGTASPDTAPSLGFVKVIAALLATLACIFVVAAIIKRTPLGGSSGSLRLENRLTLSRGGSLAVVRVEGRRLVVGVTPGQINLIAELDEVAAGDRAGAKPGGFERLLGGLLQREGASR